MSDRRRIPNDWTPREYQKSLWRYLQGGGKRASCVWHRRAGKDDVCLHWTARSIIEKPATYWHMLPEYAQGRKAIWTAVNPHTGRRRIDEAFPHWLRESTQEQEMFIRFRNGATWQVVGSDRYDSTVGSPPYGLVLSEWALSNPSAWAYLAPIVLENNGWALFITTSRGRNHAYTMHRMAKATPGWFAETLTIKDTGAMTVEAVEAQRREYAGIFGEEAADALIEQEYYCSFEAAVLGAYYGREMRLAEQAGRIGKVELSPDLPVHRAWDIGVDDPMAIWCFQVEPGRIVVVDYIENHGVGFDWYASELEARGYVETGGTDWVPHDARVREAGAPTIVREDGSTGSRTRIETMLALGLRPELIVDHALMDGINASRKVLGRCHFDERKCEKGIACLREYKADWDDQARVFRKSPKHDWASHGADAFRSLAMSLAKSLPLPVEPKALDIRPMNRLSMDEIFSLVDSLEGNRSARI